MRLLFPSLIPENVLAQRRSVATDALARLDSLRDDPAALARLQQTLGKNESPLTGATLSGDRLELLRDALTVLLAATADAPRRLDLGGVTLTVHNARVAELLRPRYTRAELQALFELADCHGTFAMNVDPETGLVRTSDVSLAENFEMGGRQWVTDTVRVGDLEKVKAPHAWRRAMITLARFYTQPAERAAFDRAIAGPRTYREGGPREGVAHIFDPRSLARDPGWHNNARLESHGLALGALARALLEGLAGELDDPALDQVAATLSQLAQYFDALDYPTAPSAGPWEETKLTGGLTWDTEAVRAGLSALRELLHDPAHASNASLQRVRAAVARQPARLPTTGDLDRLDALIDRGRARVITGVRGGPTVQENPARAFDAASVFIAASDVRLADTLVASVKEHFRLLDTLEAQLLRADGLIRYAPFDVPLNDGTRRTSPDSYLARNYWVALDAEGRIDFAWRERAQGFASKDASDPQVFLERAGLATPDTEAQWFMVSDLSRGWGTQVAALLAELERERRAPGSEETALIEQGLARETLALNRAYARLTGDGAVKSNGKPVRAFAVPEAYEAVSALDGETRYLAGANTPLAWAAASLFGATQQLLRNLAAFGGS